MKRKKIIIQIGIILSIFLLIFPTILAEEIEPSYAEVLDEGIGLDSYIRTVNESVKSSGIEGIDFSSIAEDMISSKGINYKGILLKLISIFSSELIGTIKGASSIFIIIIILSLVSALELDEKSDITRIARLACFVSIATITVVNFIEVMDTFKQVVSALTTLMQIISPFLMSILIATGAITTSGIIQPLLLFIASLIGFLVNYIVIPFLTISVAFNIISTVSENIRFSKMSKIFSGTGIWIVGVLLTFFLGVLSLEGSISSSVDSLALKTTQSAVSNFVPVVGKFFSDSFETVVGATKIIGRVGGGIGILATILVAIVPILKIACVMLVYQVLAALIEPICKDEVIGKYLSGFSSLYKTLLGILVGIVILFVISTGITLNLVSIVVK